MKKGMRKMAIDEMGLGSTQAPPATPESAELRTGILLAAALLLVGCGPPECKPYPTGLMFSGDMVLHIDPDNGCAYLESIGSRGRIVPKLDASGRQVCYAPKECPTDKADAAPVSEQAARVAKIEAAAAALAWRPEPSPEVSFAEVMACWKGRAAKSDGDHFGAMIRTDCRWGSIYRQDYESKDEGLRVFERGREDAMPVFSTGDERELAAIRRAIRAALSKAEGK
jgi:hypothetical protein